MSALTSDDSPDLIENQPGTLLAEQLLEFANEAFVFDHAMRPRNKTKPDAPPKRFPAPPQAYFADVQPPALSHHHLEHTRVVANREQILSHLPKGGVCLEINTGTGAFGHQILSVLKPSKLHLCDPDFNAFDDTPFLTAIERAVVELHEGEAAEHLAGEPDQHFDVICINPGHSYTVAAQVLELAARKIKDSGFIVCAKYISYSPLEGIKSGAARAVNEFCHAHPFEVSHLALNTLGYQDAVLRRGAPRSETEPSRGALPDAPDTCTFLPDVWEYLIGKYDVRSVLDVGAGAGWSTKWFAEQGIYALGVEGWEKALEQSRCRSHIIAHDYSTGPFIPSMVLDLAWCAGFVEQMEEEHIPNFMASFQACKYVCLTHAEPGQKGPHCVNCQPTSYWIEKMARFGFEHDEAETARLRSFDKHNAPRGRRTLTFFKKQQPKP